jgi:2'-phosphotransferase
MDQCGWVSVIDLLQVPSLQRFGCEYTDVIGEANAADIGDRSSKQRLEMKCEDGIDFVRACQGHSLRLDFDELLETITPASTSWVEHGLHGTFRRNMDSIIAEGLDVKYSASSSGRSRAHIHFAISIDDSRENAGVRGGTDIVVVCDLGQMYNAGMIVYRSRNNVILTPGLDGCVPPEFITEIYSRSTGEVLHPTSNMTSWED